MIFPDTRVMAEGNENMNLYPVCIKAIANRRENETPLGSLVKKGAVMDVSFNSDKVKKYTRAKVERD